jgi:hypothetical protein
MLFVNDSNENFINIIIGLKELEQKICKYF